ncbi:unnamed protein product, partial [marine sediment metagenome]
SFKTPSKPAYYSTPVPRSVIYAGGDPEHIETLLPYFNDTANQAKSLVILQDPDDPKRPLFIVTSLRTRFFPRGTWTAYLYQDKRSNGIIDRLKGSLTLYFEPAQIPYWLTWRFLSRYLRQLIDSSNTRHLRIPQGVLIDPTLSSIPLLPGEGGKHSRLGLSEGESKGTRGLTPTVKGPGKLELTLLSPDEGKLSGTHKGWRVLVPAKPDAPANSQASVSSAGIMGGHQGTSTASRDLVATQDAFAYCLGGRVRVVPG